jgi:phosphoglycolate phosphatase-like HAD superfamily hydrolase
LETDEKNGCERRQRSCLYHFLSFSLPMVNNIHNILYNIFLIIYNIYMMDKQTRDDRFSESGVYKIKCKGLCSQLNEMLQLGSENIIVINREIVDHFKKKECKAVVFDFDGVLTKEIDIAEKGYAWVIRVVRDGIIDPNNVELQNDDIEIARNFRPTIKGKSMVEKVNILREKFGKASVNLTNSEIIVGWYDFFRFLILSIYGENKNEYILPGAEELLNESHRYFKVFGVTANEQQYATWLMEFVCLKKYFNEIVGYPIHASPGTTKASLLDVLLSRWEIPPEEVCFIGDGVTDIIAGKSVGTLTIGMANNEMPIGEIKNVIDKERVINKALANGKNLIEAGCDILATSTLAYPAILYALAPSGRSYL